MTWALGSSSYIYLCHPFLLHLFLCEVIFGSTRAIFQRDIDVIWFVVDSCKHQKPWSHFDDPIYLLSNLKHNFHFIPLSKTWPILGFTLSSEAADATSRWDQSDIKSAPRFVRVLSSLNESQTEKTQWCTFNAACCVPLVRSVGCFWTRLKRSRGMTFISLDIMQDSLFMKLKRGCLQPTRELH